MAGGFVRRRVDRFPLDARRVVRGAGQAGMESAQLDFLSRLDRALRAHGRVGLAGLATVGLWRRAGGALGLFVLQLALNGLWSYLFFGLHRLDLALFEVVALWGTILVVTILFWDVNRLAGALLLPYLVWVGFASFLNFTLWSLNRG